MPLRELYHTWKQKINTLVPGLRKTQLQNFVWLLVGLFYSRSVHQSKIAAKIPGLTRLPSRTRRVQRFLDNPAVQPRAWYRPVAEAALQQAAAAGEVRLLMDASVVGPAQRVLMVAVAYRKRAIPVAWTWVPGLRGHSAKKTQRALLKYVHDLLPPQCQVSLAGDVEFGAVSVQKLLDKWQWTYVLRQQSHYLYYPAGQTEGQRLDSFVTQAGEWKWLPGGKVTKKHKKSTNLLVYWHPQEKEPWFLITNLATPQATLRLYRRRMWIEELFGDLKKHGFDLELTRIRKFQRLSRLLLAVVLLYVWLLSWGGRLIKQGLRKWVDRGDRRDYSLFRLGMNMAERKLVNDQPFKISFRFCF